MMDYIPCSFDSFIDNFLACYRPCYSDYLQQLVTNGTCGTNYTTLAASTDRSDLKCICENADGVSSNWTSQVLECTHSSCNGTFNYTRWADSMWSYDICAITLQARRVTKHVPPRHHPRQHLLLGC
ncbi:hypothetical protein BO85DRAFT_25919 [Aspergillus piperis CBS 112811]|uniref:Uncharacterized protein n=1 Tax=Aspergillus piperis CBS 112811 TaxID=1448313 RepID=A0A8G1RC97_9EURO|nr:hypothetical protein BO85DRAFT_25919 [Aspergillus piperis CBS 112811]RAH63553.1 hypothetical protein BO85DRAFT_25919 [Aspergillus piperis CBS 112811]